MTYTKLPEGFTVETRPYNGEPLYGLTAAPKRTWHLYDPTGLYIGRLETPGQCIQLANRIHLGLIPQDDPHSRD